MLSIATLDIEASGLASESYPIEIGIALPDGYAYCSLIKPADHWTHWSPEAESIHGISRNDLIAYGKTATEVARTLNQLLHSTTVYTDCWTIDHPWLIKLFQEAGFNNTFTLQDIMYLLDEELYTQLAATKKQLFSKLDIKRHRATNDAKVLQLAYETLLT